MNDNNTLLGKLGQTLSGEPGLDDLLTMVSHHSGFKRENAVRRLGMLGNPAAIPYLIVRANDWVPQVRAAAYEALGKLLKAGNGPAFVESLPRILHLQSCGRSDHSALLQAVQDFLLREDNRAILLAGMQNPNPRVARLVTRLLIREQLMSSAEIVATGLAHKDVVVRSIAVELLRELAADAFGAATSMALRDSYMPVRREAFQQLLRRDPQQGVMAARDLLFDPSASIREIAVQRLLGGGAPVEEMYAAALAGDKTRVATVKCVLWGWGFMNSRTRVAQVEQLLSSRYPAVRRAALQSITRLVGGNGKRHLEAALADVSPAVSNESARLMVRLRVIPDVAALILIVASNRLDHVARACCRVIREGNKWDWLLFALSAYGEPDSVVPRDEFSREIDTWQSQFNRSSAQPAQSQLDRIGSLLESRGPKLSSDQIDLLRFTLRSYGVGV